MRDIEIFILPKPFDYPHVFENRLQCFALPLKLHVSLRLRAESNTSQAPSPISL